MSRSHNDSNNTASSKLTAVKETVHQINDEAIAAEHNAPLELDSHSLHWHDLQQGKFLGCLALAGLGIRSVLYPAALVKVSLSDALIHTHVYSTIWNYSQSF
jgi:hypothetical protein